MKGSDLFQLDNRFQLSRLLTEVENDTDTGRIALDRFFSESGTAHLVGITGAPGTGKSSLVNRLAQVFRSKYGKSVAIVAVDPSSPFTGGAIMGDRIRMRDLSGDPGVFIRSMSTRGELGGLARATAGVVQMLDAAGFEIIMIETVGAGQSEVEIARLAHTTIVVEAPGFGDDIQAIKAGILEIADILVINKADLPGADSTERALRANLELGYTPSVTLKAGHQHPAAALAEVKPGWVPPVIKTISTTGEGADQVAENILSHHDMLQTTGLLEERDQERLRVDVEHQLRSRLIEDWRSRVPKEKYDRVMDEVYARKRSPRSASEVLTRK